ncbi:MAG TPA: cytochrome c oxidase assembly protein [Solirubrobacterales bacterium]|nr:cytochrome c oxidase assembly protein [Solirubrobacterales bacterium]
MVPPAAHVAGAFAPLELVPIAVAAVLYRHRAMALSRDDRPVPTWRQVCFGAGLATIAVALFSPVGHIADELVVAHMVEHLLIGDIASLLLVLGLTRSILQPVLAIHPLNRLQVLTHPAVALPLWAFNLFLWHVPAIYQQAYGAAPLHALEHTTFLFFGCLMWMPIFGPLPKPEWFNAAWKVGYVVAVRFVGALLGNVLMWSGSVLYPIYAAGERYWGISPLTDQSTAGVLMMVEGTFVALGVLAWVFFEVAREGTEKQRLLDLAGERGVALDERRAQRAVAAGHTALLEERLMAGGEGAGEGEGDGESLEPRVSGAR